MVIMIQIYIEIHKYILPFFIILNIICVTSPILQFSDKS